MALCTIHRTLFVGILALSSASCVSWTPGWKMSREKPYETPRDLQVLRAKALEAGNTALGWKGVDAWIDAWKAVLRADPNSYEALTTLASASTLAGLGYARSIGEKGDYYRKAIQYAERAMALDPGFLAKVQGKVTVADAVAVLPKERVDAMTWWAAALTFYYDQCLGIVVQATNVSTLQSIEKVLARVEALDPAWLGAAPGFLRAIVAVRLPEKFGGGIKRAGERADQAVKDAPGWLRNRWGRGMYVAKAREDDLQARADMEWLAAQDPKLAPGPVAWNQFFVREGKGHLGSK